MSSTYLTLCQQMRQEVGVSGTGPAAVTSQTGMMKKIIDWVADADVAICNKYTDWGFLHSEFPHSTIASTKDVSAPSDFGLWDMKSFVLDYSTAAYKKLKPMDYWVWRDDYRNGVKTNAKPDFIIVKPDKDLILEPPPDAVYSLTADYYKTATRMTTNSSVSLIPIKFDRIIIAQAKIYYAEHENAPEILSAAKAEYSELMTQLEALYLRGHESRTKGHDEDMVVVVE